MVRDVLPEADESAPEPGGTVELTGPGVLVVLGLVGLFLGWAARGQALRSDFSSPSISWLAVGVTWFVVAVTAGTAYLTWRTVRRARHSLTPQQGLARLVLGKTIARLAAFAFGGSLGSAVSYLGVGGESAQSALLHALAAALGAGAGIAAGLLLEHACRVPPSA